MVACLFRRSKAAIFLVLGLTFVRMNPVFILGGLPGELEGDVMRYFKGNPGDMDPLIGIFQGPNGRG